MAVSMLPGLLIVPFYADSPKIDAAEQGLPARARGIFKPYRQSEALRLIGTATDRRSWWSISP